MPKNLRFKPVTIQPATGLMDGASDPNLISLGGWRLVRNMARNRDGRVCRATGWERLFASRDSNNWDLHYQGDYVRQNITLLYEAVTPIGYSKLYAGTQNRIYALNGESGNWNVISDLLGGAAQSGCAETRFKGAHSGRFVFFTNGKEDPLYHVQDQPAEDNGQSVKTLRDFEILKITKAKIVVTFNNMTIWMNLEMDGQWQPNAIIWSNYRKPLSYVPSSASLAGRFFLDDGDHIVAAAHAKNSMLIYTTSAIWEMTVSGAAGVFGFTRRWRSNRENGTAVLAFPNTLVANGDTHYYLGRDTVYQYGPYISEPESVDWVFDGTRDIFKTIDKSRCSLHVGGFDDETKEIYFSWATATDECPSRSMVINVRHPYLSHLDHGFSAFLSHNPDSPKTLRTFMKEWCICPLSELGNLKQCGTEAEATCEITPDSFYSTELLTDAGIVVENHTGEPTANSLFTALGDRTISDLYTDELGSDECNAEKVFVMASTTDKCLKSAADLHYRERCVDLEGCGTYSLVGYESLLRSGALDLRLPDDDKVVNRFAIQAHPSVETIPARILLRVGTSAVAEDPNSAEGTCVIMWMDQGYKTLECMGGKTAAQHALDGTRPSDETEWPLYQIGRYLYFELQIDNPATDDTGGRVCFSRLTFDAAAAPRR